MYNTWKDLKRRCDDSDYWSYPRYGGRGITYVDAWRDFAAFKKDMEGSYHLGFCLDRVNNDGNYCKENCRWVSKQTSARYNSRTKLSFEKVATIKEEFKTGQFSYTDLARKYKISVQVIWYAINGHTWRKPDESVPANL